MVGLSRGVVVACAAALTASLLLVSPVSAVPPASQLVNPGLGGVVALSGTDAWAVGANNEGPDETVLIEHWDGTTWRVVRLPKMFGGLYEVSASSPSDVWAVGYYTKTGSVPFLTLTMHWDGTAWSQVPSPNLGSTVYNILFGVSAHGTDDAWAAGTVVTKRAKTIPVATHWTGTRWSRLTQVGSPTSPVDGFTGIATPTAQSAVAVGYCQKADLACPSGANRSAIYSYQHGTWQPVATRNLGMLYSVDSLGPADIWAAGQRGVAHFDGTTWKHLDTALSGKLVDIAPLSSRFALAVGQDDAESWNGTTWQKVSTPGLGFVSSVSLDTPNDGWAVGGTGSQQLIEHWDGASLTQYPTG